MCKSNLIKECLNCKICFPKPYYESKKAWETRHKFCSRKCSDEFKIGKTQTKESNEKRRKWSIENDTKRFLKHKKGAENSNWKGGVTKQNKNRNSTEYRKWRKQVLNKDNHTCQKCNSKENLQAHHIKQYAHFPELRLDVSNGCTLCKKCHKKVEVIRNKGNHTPTTQDIEKQLLGREREGLYERIGLRVKQIDLNTGEVLKTFRSIHKAAKSLGKKCGSIRAHLGLIKNKNKTTHAHGYKWELY